MIGQPVEAPATERFEYQGHTMIEHILGKEGIALRRDWLIFDTVEEAETYYNEYCVSGER